MSSSPRNHARSTALSLSRRSVYRARPLVGAAAARSDLRTELCHELIEACVSDRNDRKRVGRSFDERGRQAFPSCTR